MATQQATAAAPSSDGTYSGYLVIADIFGYTGFLAHNELVHAQGILSELTTLLIEQLAAPFRFVELEGDRTKLYMRMRAAHRGWLNRTILRLFRWLPEREWAGHYEVLERVLREDMERLE